MEIRDRIKELRRVPAAELKPNPRNWRSHPKLQRAALRGVLAEVGYADALLARELPDGSLELIDGHLRAEATPDAMVPVLVLDVNEAEANKILLTHDPLAAMANAEAEPLAALIASVTTENSSVADLMQDLANEHLQNAGIVAEAENRPDIEIPDCFQVVVECENEVQQQELYERMREEGRRCRVLTL